MSSFQLKAEKREKLGSLEARRIKNSGKIPAVIYSKNGNINISVDKRAFEIEFAKGSVQTRVIEIDVDGKKIKTITHQVDLDPVSDQPIHIDLLNCEENKQISAKPKLNFLNQDKSPGLKKGGFLHVVLRQVEIVCDNEKDIPEKIDVDVGSLQVGSKLRSSRLKLPEGVKLVKKGDFLIASIIGRGKAEEETPVAAAAAAPVAGAAGAAAPAAAGAAKPAAKDDKKK